MEFRLAITDLQNPDDIVALKRAISTLADECDVLYSEVSPNNAISSRIGRRCVYNNGGTITYWVNTDGALAWRQLTDSANEMWVVDGTETQLRTADEIDMQSKKIINVTNPASDQDAATKKFHDDDISAKMNTSTGHDHDGSDSKSIPMTALGTGTPGATNYLRGDGSWQVLSTPTADSDTDTGTSLTSIGGETTFLSKAKTITSGHTVLLIATGYFTFTAESAITIQLKHGTTVVQTILVTNDDSPTDKRSWSASAIVTGLSGSITFSVTATSNENATIYGNLNILEF